jgi:hypothetical protein
MSVMRRPCRAMIVPAAGGTARDAGLTQEFLRDHFEVARRIFLWLFVGQVAELARQRMCGLARHHVIGRRAGVERR